MAEAASESAASVSPAKQVLYCGVCTLPPEYCEFGGTASKCQSWLKDNHSDLHDKLYSAEALEKNVASLSVEAQKRAEKDAIKKTAQAEKKEAAEQERKASAMVYIKRIERTKRKYITAVSGLEAHGLELKKVSKDMAKKFATSASVTKVASGGEEITIQGDLSDDIFDWLTETYGEKIPEDNIDFIDDTKKKKSAG